MYPPPGQQFHPDNLSQPPGVQQGYAPPHLQGPYPAMPRPLVPPAGGYPSGPPSQGGFPPGPSGLSGFPSGPPPPISYNPPPYAPVGGPASGTFPQQQFTAGTSQYNEYTAHYPPGPAQPSPFNPQSVPFGPGPGLFPTQANVATSLMSTLAPQYFLNAGNNYQQYVKQQLSWLSSPALHTSFVVSKQYVMTKILLLLTPYLKRWSYTRQHEQVQGGRKYCAPRADVNAPDLYIPVMAMWTYAVLLCLQAVLLNKFKPDLMYSSVWTGCMAWLVHMIVCWLVLRALPVQLPIPWMEIMAYTGYAFVHVCLQVLTGAALGKWAYYIAWVYGSFCMSTFLVRTLKWIYIQELMQQYHQDVQSINYRLLLLAGFQFIFSFYLGLRL